GIGGSGTLGLNLADNGSIRDLAGNPLSQSNAPASFQDQVTFATGALPNSVAAADLNGDGRLDLAIANVNSASVSVLLGNGNGSFQGQTTFAVGAGPHSVAAADLNGDGRLDLAIANFNNVSVSVLLGNGNGSFQGQTTFAVGAGPRSVA